MLGNVIIEQINSDPYISGRHFRGINFGYLTGQEFAISFLLFIACNGITYSKLNTRISTLQEIQFHFRLVEFCVIIKKKEEAIGGVSFKSEIALYHTISATQWRTALGNSRYVRSMW